MLFRRSVSAVLIAAAPLSLLAQVPFRPKEDVVFFNHAAPGIPGGDIPEEWINRVRATLSLSEAQVNALKTLLTMRSQATMQIQQTELDNQKKLDDVMSQTNPNPTEVGNAFLASRSTRDQLQAAEEKFRSDFRALLSPEQRSTVDKLQTSSDQAAGLTRLGILSGKEEGIFVRTGPITYPGAAIGFQRKLSNDR